MKRFGSTLFVLLASFIAVRGYAQSHTFTRVVIILQRESNSGQHLRKYSDVPSRGRCSWKRLHCNMCSADTGQVPMMQNSDGLVTCYDLGHGPTSW